MPSQPDYDCRILVVDDAPVMLRIMRGLLAHLGYHRVDGAASAEAALAILQRQPYDLVISDYHMGAMSGYDLLHAMRSHPNLSRIPFLLTTTQEFSTAANEEARALLRRSAIKPFSAATLLEKMGQAFADHQPAAAEHAA